MRTEIDLTSFGRNKKTTAALLNRTGRSSRHFARRRLTRAEVLPGAWPATAGCWAA